MTEIQGSAFGAGVRGKEADHPLCSLLPQFAQPSDGEGHHSPFLRGWFEDEKTYLPPQQLGRVIVSIIRVNCLTGTCAIEYRCCLR